METSLLLSKNIQASFQSIRSNHIWHMVAKDNGLVADSRFSPDSGHNYQVTTGPRDRNIAVFQTVTMAAQRKCGMIILHYRERASSTGDFYWGEAWEGPV